MRLPLSNEEDEERRGDGVVEDVSDRPARKEV